MVSSSPNYASRRGLSWANEVDRKAPLGSAVEAFLLGVSVGSIGSEP